MIIKEQTSSIERIGNVTEESAFKMRTSQKAFQILSSLYSDKPLAIVRELGCNAMDSHIASGQPNRPFDIHLPNVLEPWLEITDYGTGISHENIYEIYSVYFASTKTNTNSQVGMLGLGSKSPFCYTDNFTITSRHNKVERIYNAYFNQDGMPTISLASQNNTSGENGISIKIPVKQTDTSDFYRAVQSAFQFFDVKPNVVGGAVNWNNMVPMFEGSFWKSYSGFNNSYAIMGGVAYPIDTYKVDNEHYDIVRKAGLAIKFNIGELDITPSRESLMYHDWVIKALNEKIELVKKDFVAKVEQTIKTSPDLLEAMKALYLLKDQWSFLNSSMINGKVMWNKIDISEPRKAVKGIAPSLKSYAKTLWGRKKWSESEYPAFGNNIEWYYDNLKRGSIKRIATHVRTNALDGYGINMVSEDDMKNLIKSGFPASIFKPTSNLPAIASSKRGSMGRNSRPKGVIALYNIGLQSRISWDSDDFDLAQDTPPKYYIVKQTDGWGFDKMKYKCSQGNTILDIDCKGNLASYIAHKQIEVCMVAKQNEKFLRQLGSKPLSEFIENDTPVVDWNKIAIAKQIDYHFAESLRKHKLYSKLDINNPLRVFCEFVIEAKKEYKKFEPFSRDMSVDSKKYPLTYPSNMVKLFYLSSGNWQIGGECVLNAALEMQNQ